MTDAKTKTTKKSSAKPAVKSRASGATVKKAAGKTTGTKGGQKNDQDSTAAKGRGRSKSTAQQTMPLKKEKSLLRYEIELITLFALTILSAVAIHTNLTGYFGAIMKAIYLGLFGFAGILLTYMIFMLIFFNINPYFKEKRLRLSLSAVCLFIAVLLLASGINYAAYSDVIDKQGYTIGSAEALRISFNQGIDLRGGGILGNLLTEGLISAIGKFGVYLMSLLLFAISIVLAFKVSLTSWVKRGGVNTYKGLKPVAGKLKQMPEQMQQKRLEQAKVEAAKMEDAKQAENMETESKQPIDAFDSDLYFEDQQTQPTDEAVTPTLASDTVDEATLNQLDSTSETYIDEETGEYINVETVFDIEGSLEPMDAVDDDVSVVHFEVPDLAETQAEVAEDLSTSDMPAFKFTDSIEEPELTEVIEVDEVEVGEEPELIAETAAVVKPPLKTEPEPVVKPVVIPKPYIKPPLSLLNPPKAKVAGNREEIAENVKVLEATLKSFGVDARVTEVTKGPAITMYEVSPAPGVKVSKIVNLQDDIALALAASQIRIIAPIPGKSAVGIEIPNKDTTMVTAREVFESDEFKKSDSKLAFGLGKDITGRTIIADLAKMPHLLIAGSTGSGKSVCVNTIINSILFNATPDEVKLLMVDPKVVELSHYNGIPHLILPVVVDPKKASIALNWAVNEMTNRYKTFAENMVKDINTYNRKAETQPDLKLEKMPKIVVLVDELADLMMVAPNQVEDAICRLAQMARAAGIHLIVATQRPSVDVITGVIKANIPSRIAFAVSSQIDSRTIIDGAGAEKLLGKGDMLFAPLGSNKPIRVQGAFLADPEVEAVVEFVKNQATDVTYQEEILSDYVEATTSSEADEILQDAIELVVDTGQASISMLQRKFRVGYNRAARLIDQMEERNIVGPSLGSKPREVLLTKLEWENIKNT